MRTLIFGGRKSGKTDCVTIDPETLSELLEVLGRAMAKGDVLLKVPVNPRVAGAAALVREAAGALDNPPDGGWPGQGTVSQRRAWAHLKMFNEDALADATRACRER